VVKELSGATVINQLSMTSKEPLKMLKDVAVKYTLSFLSKVTALDTKLKISEGS